VRVNHAALRMFGGDARVLERRVRHTIVILAAAYDPT
jgi:hypothetical protein